MLVVLIDDRVILPCQVCQTCLLADRSGQPRWRHGKLICGRAIEKLSEQQPDTFECEMGFRIANIE